MSLGDVISAVLGVGGTIIVLCILAVLVLRDRDYHVRGGQPPLKDRRR